MAKLLFTDIKEMFLPQTQCSITTLVPNITSRGMVKIVTD